VIRIRSVPLPPEDVRELVDWLDGDETATELVGRLNRALLNRMGVVGTDPVETRAMLHAVDAMLDRGPAGRLLELRGKLVARVER
jgi:hypothetical protein